MKKIFLTLATAVLLCGCSEQESIGELSNEMQFMGQMPATRVTASAFEQNDQMSVYVTKYEADTPSMLQFSGNYANNVKSTFDGVKWNSSTPVYWSEGKFDVFAFYPYGEPTSVKDYRFSVALDQSTTRTPEALGGYEASDLLWAKATAVTKAGGIVPLTFSHRMSKLTVKLKKGPEYEGAFPDDIVVRVHNVVCDATVDIASGIVTVDGRATRKSVTANKLALDTYSAIIVPQRMDNKLLLIEIMTKGVSYLVEGRFVFKAGMEHIYTVTLNGNPDQIKIEIGGEIVQQQ